MQTETTDVVIAGAGPGGMAASHYLSAGNIPHVILEKGKFPRDKVCGDAISGKVLNFIKRIDASLISRLKSDLPSSFAINGIDFGAPDGNVLSLPFQPPGSDLPAGFVIRRTEFDHFLAQHLSNGQSDLREECTLLNAEKTDEYFLITYRYQGRTHTLKSRLVIAADGQRSVIRKSLHNIPFKDRHFSAGIRAYYKNVTAAEHHDHIELLFLKQLQPGYLWIFPMADGYYNVGLGIFSNVVKSKNLNLRKLLDEIVSNDPLISPRFKNAKREGPPVGWGLPMGSEIRPISGNGYVLTGDAGGLIDPFTGEGIANAMVSGKYAGLACEKALKKGDFSSAFFKMHYDTEVYKRIQQELQISSWLQKLAAWPFLFNLVIRKARNNPAIRQTLINMFIEVDLRKEFKKPSFYWKLIRH